MSLTIREQSEQLKAAAAERLPAEVLEVFERSIQDFLDQGVPSERIAAGDTLGSFTLNDATGTPVTLDQLVERARRSSSSTGVAGAPTATWRCAPTNRNSSRSCRLRARLVAISPQTTRPVPLHRREGRSRVHGALRPGQPPGPTGRHLFQHADDVLEGPTQAGPRPHKGQRRGLRPSCPGPPSLSSTRTARCASSTSSPTTGPAPRSPISSPRLANLGMDQAARRLEVVRGMDANRAKKEFSWTRARVGMRLRPSTRFHFVALWLVSIGTESRP